MALPGRVLRVGRVVGSGRWNVFVGEQRSYSMAGTGQIAGTVKRRRGAKVMVDK